MSWQNSITTTTGTTTAAAATAVTRKSLSRLKIIFIRR